MTAEGTELVYQRDSTLTTHDTRVVSVQRFDDLPEDLKGLFKEGNSTHHVVVTTSTIFCAQGGGQPPDTGTMTSLPLSSPSTSASFEVLSVRYGPSYSILHFGTFATASSSELSFTPGQQVHQSLNVPLRTLHARIHTAGHILGLAVRSLRNAGVVPADIDDLKAMHYPSSAFVDFTGLIDSKHKDAIQAKCDEIVAANMAVKVHFWTEEEMLERCASPPAKEMVQDAGPGGLLRAVEVEGWGSYPCGGTPTVGTGNCGMIIKKIQRKSGVSKVSYKVLEDS